MPPAKLPSLDELVSGMKNAPKTEKWDVVVSYSVAELNAVLQKLWTANRTTCKLDKFSAKREGPGHSVYYTDFNITLGAPTLTFTLTQEACLKMKITGTCQDRDDNKTYTEEAIPSGYYFHVTLPLAGVKADGNVTEKPVSQGNVIIFDQSKATETIRVVFSFDRVENASSYEVTRESSETGEDLFQNAKASLAAALQKKFPTLKYALAEVAQTPVDGATFLTPEHVYFTIYPTKDKNQGCLSLYIKTKDSGYQDGFSTTAFRFDTDDAIPIPEGHTASIIIRRELIQKFLREVLENATAYDQKALTVSSTSGTTGFSYSNTLNESFKNSFHKHTALGDYEIREFEWSFNGSPLTVDITNNTATWDMSYKNSFEWLIHREYVRHGEVTSEIHWGKVLYHLSMNQKAPILTLDDNKITAKIEVRPGWWKREAKPEEASTWEKLNGKKDTIPGPVQDWVNGWQFPTFSSTMRLDFFATTNVFAPGKHIINIDTEVGVFTPYDLLILGKIAPPSSL
ncbi:hypothetical protein AJ80_04289 [Polytolypa hystricis UAMH7299]|uniref:Uncharacterized protein n=1 Tax=Polytolypa hystricis (strain UAMH7299) TaxID=1447883 RepID=A0A2B7YDL0_POLH7|nr:hypothetical protein AJ80_04289 [Polytolypa hystricis UAMH7299]